MSSHNSSLTASGKQGRRTVEREWEAILFTSHPQPMWICDPETLAIREVNQAAIERYGYSREMFLGMSLHDLAARGQTPGENPLGSLPAGDRATTWRTLHRRRDGAVLSVEVTARPFLLEGRPAVIVMGQDITEQVRAERTLHRNQQWYRQIVEALQEGIWLIDAHARTWYVNERMAELLGYCRQEMVGRPLYDFLDEKAQIVARRNVERRFEGVTTRTDFRFRRKDGSALWAIVSVKPLYNEAGRFIGALKVIVDVTQRRQLEQQLQQAQKMEAIGRLAGGVAHDFNNIITVITGYSDLLLRSLEETSPLRRIVEEMKRAGERAALLTSQLLTFSRKQAIEPRLLDVNAVIADAERMLRRLIGEDIQLLTRLNPETGAVRADPGQLQQVLINLVVNARDAMPQGGTLTIETDPIELDAASAHRYLTLRPGPYVKITVSDTGCGMDADTMAHIFEPFFTTKGPEKGTGLGLATVYGIVTHSGGHISVTSEVGRGTTFTIYLPRVVPEPQREAPSSGSALGGTETVLVAEDEPTVRHLIGEILRHKGYTVLEASNGIEALEMARRYSGPIHLLLTDVVMPQMNGNDLARWLQSERPKTKVLLMSGYSSHATVGDNLVRSSLPFLSKPFHPQELVARVRQILDAVVIRE